MPLTGQDFVAPEVSHCKVRYTTGSGDDDKDIRRASPCTVGLELHYRFDGAEYTQTRTVVLQRMGCRDLQLASFAGRGAFLVGVILAARRRGGADPRLHVYL